MKFRPTGCWRCRCWWSCRSVGWAAVLEANLTDYAGMYLARGTAAGRQSGQPALAAPGRAEDCRPRDAAARLALAPDPDRQGSAAAARIGHRAQAQCAERDQGHFVDQAGQDDVSLVERLLRSGRAVQDGPQHRDGQVLHRFLRRVRHPVSHARRGQRPGLVRRTHRALRRRRHHQGNRRARSPGSHRLCAAERRAAPAVDALAGGEAAHGPGISALSRVGHRRRDDRLHGPRRSGDGQFPARAAAAGGRQSSDRDVSRRRGADRPGADVSESAQQRGGAQSGVRQVGRGRRAAGARRHRAAHADARRAARLSPGLAPRRAARAIQAESRRAAGDWHAHAGCWPRTSCCRTTCR